MRVPRDDWSEYVGDRLRVDGLILTPLGQGDGPSGFEIRSKVCHERIRVVPSVALSVRPARGTRVELTCVLRSIDPVKMDKCRE